MTAIAVLRPEPGNARTVARITALGREALPLPLFAVRPLRWRAPDPDRHDALILTSANAVRHAGPALATLRALPVFAVGEATANAARAAGLTIRHTGTDNAAALLREAGAAGVARALHLGGRETSIQATPPVAATIAVYASDTIPLAPDTLARVRLALLHSARAARRFAELADNAEMRPRIAVAAISPAVAAAAGTGWRALAVAATPSDAALIEAAMALDD